MTETVWKLSTFSDLDCNQLYQLLKLRVDVFVVEQQCPYPELDGKDQHPDAKHLLAYQQNKLVAYSRLLPPGCSYPAASIGRILVAQNYRNQDLGRTLVKKSISLAKQLWPELGITIGAQSQLQNFYTSCGFAAISAPYMEDGIEHLNMHFD